MIKTQCFTFNKLCFIADDAWKNERDNVIDWLLEEKIIGNDFENIFNAGVRVKKIYKSIVRLSNTSDDKAVDLSTTTTCLCYFFPILSFSA